MKPIYKIILVSFFVIIVLTSLFLGNSRECMITKITTTPPPYNYFLQETTDPRYYYKLDKESYDINHFAKFKKNKINPNLESVIPTYY
jgi:hypothetical protein